jgi:putative transposase
MPDTLAQLDLLLLTLARPRRVRRDGIHFQCYRYIDPTLAGYVGEDVIIRYDPRDMAEIWIYHQNTFVCRAICQELAGQTVTLKQIMQARQRRQRDLRQVITDHAALVQTYLDVHQPTPEFPELDSPPDEPDPTTPKPAGLKGYYND